jgi:alkaline phosphatase D
VALDRRRFLQASIATGGGLWLAGRLPGVAGGAPVTPPRSAATGLPYVSNPLFTDGVLSGDPRPDSVLLWTRVDPTLDAGGGVDVTFEVATAPDIAPISVVSNGVVHTTAGEDHTVQVDVTGLSPDTTYWYRFTVSASDSPVGRTRTAPAAGASTGPVRFAFFSCERWTHGWYTAHHDLAELALDPATDLAFVVCLGDYVYNTGFADDFQVRPDPVGDAVTLDDFRAKYHLYRSDLNLQAMHANFPVVCIFDNHDGQTDPTDPQGPGAIAAFFEQLPVRRFAPGSTRQHRVQAWGGAVDVFLLDERQHRDVALSDDPDALLGTHTDDRPGVFDPNRTMLGDDQRNWLLTGLTSSTARWKVVGSQQMFWPWRTEADPEQADAQHPHPGRYLNLEQWDGYMWERDQILLTVEGAGGGNPVENVMVISGDDHVFSAAELSPDWDDCERDPVLVEFNGASISSSNADERGLPETPITRPLLQGVNPFVRYFDGERHGYATVELSDGQADVQYRSPITKDQPVSDTEVLVSFRVAAGSSRIEPTGAGANPFAGCAEPGPVTASPAFTG